MKKTRNNSLENLDDVLNIARMGIWCIELFENEKPRMSASDKMRELLGLGEETDYSEEETYEAWHSRIHPDAIQSVNESVERMIAGKHDENTYRWIHPTKGLRYVRCGGIAHHIEGKGYSIKGYHYDVTDIVRKEKEQLEHLEASIEESKAKTIMLQNMTHELRTPLNAILGFAQLLSLPNGTLSDEEKAEYFKYIYNSFNMLNMHIDDVLDIADFEHGNYRIETNETNINENCRIAMQMAESRCREEVHMYFTSDVDDKYTIMSDGRRIQQVLVNYLTNACKHTVKGEIHLHVSTTETPGRLTFSVTDTGEGIPAEMHKEIFERYKKAGGNTVKGSGLGLNICFIIASKLNGEVRIDSSYTDGARFLFIL